MRSLTYLVFLIFLGITLTSACFPIQDTETLPLSSFPNDSGQTASTQNPALVDALVSLEDKDNDNEPTPPEDMMAFEGTVVVATTDLNTNLWHDSGWQISDKPLNTEKSDIPEDCTLYPHFGVTNQWIGSCAGYVLVPRNGAKHIAVMITSLDGTTNMVQVAPEPANP